jgi:sec-independent protein translocase protein TatC
MSQVTKALGQGSLHAASAVGNVVRHPLAPVKSARAAIQDIWNPPPDTPEVFEEMTLFEHLDELRSRIVKSCVAFAPAFVIGLIFSKPLIALIERQAHITEGFQILSPTEPFTDYMKVALYIGLAIAFPVIFYQAIAFVGPGLTRREKRFVLMSLPFVTILFILGVLFAFFVAAPQAFGFLSTFGDGLFRWDPRGQEVLNFYLKLMIGAGLAFQLPAVMFVLAKLHILSAKKQAELWRFAFVGILFAAALITPTPDPFNMLVAASPLLALYGIGLLLARRA